MINYHYNGIIFYWMTEAMLIG